MSYAVFAQHLAPATDLGDELRPPGAQVRW